MNNQGARIRVILKELGFPDTSKLRGVLEMEWESSQKCLPGDTLPFLMPESVTNACQTLSLPEDAEKSIFTIAKKISSSPWLCALAWHFHYCAFLSTTYPVWGQIEQWPSANHFKGVMENNGRTFYLLILISGLPYMQNIYDKRSIPLNIFSDTLIQLKDELTNLHKNDNVWGLSGPDRIQWHRFALKGELFLIGRLSFQFGTFGYTTRVFRHKTSHVVLTLSGEGVSFLSTGQINGLGRENPTGEWLSEFIIEKDGVTGHPILPSGRALRRKIHLSATEWQQILTPDDPALHIHVPGGSPLTHNLCGKSIELAIKFFQQHFPERPYKCFCIHSWILNSQLQEFLPSTSNMVRFQREMYLLPHETYDMQLCKCQVVFPMSW